MNTPAERTDWYEITSKADEDHAEIRIYSVVGESFWEETVSAKQLVEQLDNLDVSAISLRINSPGGSVWDGNVISNALKRHRATVTAYVDGVAASIASVIACAADKVVMAPNAMMMIHNPRIAAYGESDLLRKRADLLDKLRDQMVAEYQGKSGQSAKEIGKAMDAETWYNAEEAVGFGLADEIAGDDEGAEAIANFDVQAFERYRHTPPQVAAMFQPPSEPAPAVEPENVVDGTWEIDLARAQREREAVS